MILLLLFAASLAYADTIGPPTLTTVCDGRTHSITCETGTLVYYSDLGFPLTYMLPVSWFPPAPQTFAPVVELPAYVAPVVSVTPEPSYGWLLFMAVIAVGMVREMRRLR